MSVPLAEMEMPNEIWSVPLGTGAVLPEASVQAEVGGNVLSSVQYVHPAPECRKTVSELRAEVDLYQTDRS